MGWLWNNTDPSDPTKTLKGDLKQFLDEQQPKNYTLSDPPQREVPTKPKPQPQSTSTVRQDSTETSVPKESLFQDGRYKDIWKTYIPQEELEVASSTAAERVMNAKKDRRQMINRAALENCAFEEELKMTCFSNGTRADRIKARMTMCSQETKAFNRCYQLQAKFLQALGYMGNSSTTLEDEEKLQMHADKLYHRMMDYEVSVDEAKRLGKPVPPLTSVFNPTKPAPTIEEIDLPMSMERSLKKPLHELPPHERELAARAVLQEAKLAQEYVDDFFKYTTTLNEGRKERQQKLVGYFGETVGKFLIPDPPQEHNIKTFESHELERDVWKDKADIRPRYSRVASDPSSDKT